MMRYYLALVAWVVCGGVVLAEEKSPPKVTYDDDVRPIFQQKCFSCHNPDKKSADLDLTNFTNLMQGGASGASVEPGDAAASYLYELVTHQSEPIMPPESPKIPDEMIETIRKWIEGGLLENSGSTAKSSKKKKFDMGLAAPSTQRPDVIPMPARMSLQPVVVSSSPTAVDAIATSPWAPLVALSGHRQVLLYHTETLDLIGVLPFPEGVPRVLKFSRNGNLLLAGGGVGGASGRVVVWDIRTGERIIEVGEELDEVLAADISSDQKLVAMGGPQRVVRIYSTETGQLLHEIRKHTEWVTSLEFSPDSVLLATGDRNGGLLVWEGWTGREYLSLPGHTGAITDISWRADSNIVASASEDATIRLWEMENGGQVKNWAAHGGGALSVEFTRDSRIFSCGRDRTPKLWDQNGAQQIAFEAFGDLAMRVSYCDETNRAISGDWTGEIRVWNAADGARIGHLVMNVPTLEQRLADATQALTRQQAAHQPLAAAWESSRVAYEKITAELAAMEQQSAAAQAKATTATNTLAEAKAMLAKLSDDYAAAKVISDQATAALPVLRQAADAAQAAAAQTPDDKSLATAAETIQSARTAKEKQTEAAVAVTAQRLAAMQQATAQVAAAEKALAEATTAVQAAMAKQQQMTALVKPAEDAYTAAKAPFEQSADQLAAAQTLVNRWTDEIAFGQLMNQLFDRRTMAVQQLDESESSLAAAVAGAEEASAAVAKADAELKSAREDLAKADAGYKASLTELEAAKKQHVAAMQAKKTATLATENLQQIIAKLGEAGVKADESLALQSNDQALTAIAQSIRAAIVEKTKQLGAAEQDLVVATEALQMATTAVATAEKTAADRLAALPAMEKRVSERQTALPPLQTKAQAAAAAVEALKSTVAEVQGQVETIAREIAAARGLETDA